MFRALAVLIGLGLLVAGLAAANLRRDATAFDLDWRLIKPPPRPVSVDPLSRGNIVQTITAPATVEPVDEVEIASQLVGRVVAVEVKEGDVVKKNQILVRLDDADSRARLDSAKARIERFRSAITQAESDLAKAVRDATQAGKLSQRGFATPNERADARTTVDKAEAHLSMSKHELLESEAARRTAEQELERTVIRSPIDGVVSGVDVDLGEVVIAGTTNLPGSKLMTVSDLSRMRARADVDESDVPLVRPGQPARVYLPSDPLQPLSGSVELVAPKGKLKEEVVSFETLVGLDASSGALRPGMSATIEVEVRRSESALGVPAQSVVHRRRKDLPDTPAVRKWAERNARSPGEKASEAELRYIKIVFVEDHGVARARPVETGLSDERRVEILSGLEPGEAVIVGPFRTLDELKDGDSVAPSKGLSDLAENH